ncbi:MAG: histidinol-phosphatase [Bacteroidia bacterium]|nr:histidinol-phosphatase [Bacteroidia bacterium]
MLFVSCKQESNDQESAKQWYKGNLHTHSYWSDGDEFPEVVMDWYKTNGYQFVALSDHNTLAEGDKWKTISEDSTYQNAFKNYLDKYGSSWVSYRKDSGRIEVKLKTLQEYATRFEEKEKFLIIQSEEISDRFENKPLHMNATNIQTKIEPQGGNSVSEVLQHNIDEVTHQREVTGRPMIPHINHPNFYYAISLEDMIALKGERFFEVYNGHPQVHNSGDSIHISTEEMWDLINIAYLKNSKALMYGLATDDSHNYHRMGSKWSNAGRGWIMVLADSLSPASLITAMEAGEFYATSGVLLNRLKFDDQELSVEVKSEQGIDYKISFIGCRKGKSSPEEFATEVGTSANFKLTEDILYVRCRITSSKLHSNPIEDLLYEMAWTQPVVIK